MCVLPGLVNHEKRRLRRRWNAKAVLPHTTRLTNLNTIKVRDECTPICLDERPNGATRTTRNTVTANTQVTLPCNKLQTQHERTCRENTYTNQARILAGSSKDPVTEAHSAEVFEHRASRTDIPPHAIPLSLSDRLAREKAELTGERPELSQGS